VSPITIACLDLAGTTVRDDGTVLAAFRAAAGELGLAEGTPGCQRALDIVHTTMGMAKIEVFRRITGDESAAARANGAFEAHYAAAVRAGRIAPVDGAEQAIATLRAAGIKVCLLTGFAPATRDAVLAALGWQELADLVLSPADAGRGRPFPDLPLTALLRLGGGAVSELAVVGDTPSDVESGLRAGAGLVAGVLTGSSDRAQLVAAGAPLVLESVAALPAHLGLADGSSAG